MSKKPCPDHPKQEGERWKRKKTESILSNCSCDKWICTTDAVCLAFGFVLGMFAR